jgi:hypothetical protein
VLVIPVMTAVDALGVGAECGEEGELVVSVAL